MRKKCEKCGNFFDARESFHRLCPSCFSQNKLSGTHINISELLLDSYYDKDSHLLKAVFIDIPLKLANIFSNDKPPLGTKQLRDFLGLILKARNKALFKGIDAARPILYKCQADLEYQLKRKVIPDSFSRFMKHHISLAEKNEKLLDGFYQHLDSVVCYFPIKKG